MAPLWHPCAIASFDEVQLEGALPAVTLKVAGSGMWVSVSIAKRSALAAPIPGHVRDKVALAHNELRPLGTV